MTVITHNRRRSRLSTLIDQPGGISTRTALRQAAENLADLEVRSQAVIEAAVRDMLAATPPADIEANRFALDHIYRLSSSVIDAAGPFGKVDLCTVASNLCDLVDLAPETELFDWRVVTVHAQALRLLLTMPPEDEAARQQVVDSLINVRRVKTAGVTP